MKVVEIGRLRDRIIHAAQKLYCKHFGHNWSEWQPVKFSLFETRARHCQMCRLNETEKPVPLSSLIAHTMKERKAELSQVFRDTSLEA